MNTLCRFRTTSSALHIASAAALVTWFYAGIAESSWITDGTPLVATTGEQVATSIVSDGEGGAIVFLYDARTWQEYNIYAQRVTAQGKIAPGWPADGLPICLGAGSQYPPQAISDGEGGAIVLWGDYDRDGYVFYAQRVTKQGQTLWTGNGVRVCPVSSIQTSGLIVSDGNGGAIILWADNRDEPPPGPPHYHHRYDIYAQRLDPDGNPLWPAEGVVVCNGPSNQEFFEAVTDGGGGALVFWHDYRDTSYVQHLDGSGRSLLRANGAPIAGRSLGLFTPDGSNGVFSFFPYGSDTQRGLYVQRISSAGSIELPLHGVLISNAPHEQRPSSAIPDLDGGAYVAWHDLRNGRDWDVYLQRIDGSGRVRPGWPAGGLPVCTQSGFQIYPQMIPDGVGGAVLVWYDERDTSTVYDIYAQRITSDGAVAPGWAEQGVALCQAPGHQVNPIAVSDGSGGAIVAWNDSRGYANVYAQAVRGDGRVGDAITATQVALVSVTTFSDRMLLRWNAPLASGGNARIYRREENGVSAFKIHVAIDPSGMIEYEDSDVTPGLRYAYRVGIQVDGREEFSEEEWVEFPSRLEFRLEGFTSNPARAALVASFSLARAGRASLEMLDPMGRRMSQWLIESGEPGRRLMSLGHAQSYPSGIYFLRLTQGSEVSTARVCIVR